MRLTRIIRIRENYRLEFFAEAFNLFNHFNGGTVNTNRYTFRIASGVPTLTLNPAFGVPTTSLGPRNIQVAAKFVF
jgi:hypothetical protein